MKLINQTPWRTQDLRRIILRACRQRCINARERAILKGKWLKVVVRPGRSGVWGCAYLNTGPIYLHLRSDGLMVDALHVARVVSHEMDHVRGLTHKDMIPMETYKLDWAKAMPLRLREEPTKEKLAALKQDTRLANAAHAVKTWTRKLKLATTKLKRWQRKLDRLQEVG